MLMVKTEVKTSSIHGVGLFAVDLIPAGTVVWQTVLGFDLLIPKHVADSYPEPAQQFLKFYCNLSHDNEWLVCGDNARHMNHSQTPNISSAASVNLALRDIQAGEEITCDYREFDAEFKEWL